MATADPYHQSYCSRAMETTGVLTKMFGIVPIVFGAYRAWLVYNGPSAGSVLGPSTVTVLLHGIGGTLAAYAILLVIGFVFAGFTYIDDNTMRKAEQSGDVSKLLLRTHGAMSHNAWSKSTGALLRIGAPAVPMLIQALDEDDPPIDARPPMDRMRDKPKPSSQNLRAGAAWVLGEMREKSAVTPLIRALADLDPVVREFSAQALGKIGNAEAREALERHRDTDDTPAVQEAAKTALEHLAAT